MDFDWDDANRRHIARHDISQDEVEEVFEGIYFEIDFTDINDETRFSIIGETRVGRILIVWCTWRGDALRAVTAWEAPGGEKRRYLEARRTEYEI